MEYLRSTAVSCVARRESLARGSSRLLQGKPAAEIVDHRSRRGEQGAAMRGHNPASECICRQRVNE